jgi:hypothetical protein
MTSLQNFVCLNGAFTPLSDKEEKLEDYYESIKKHLDSQTHRHQSMVINLDGISITVKSIPRLVQFIESLGIKVCVDLSDTYVTVDEIAPLFEMDAVLAIRCRSNEDPPYRMRNKVLSTHNVLSVVDKFPKFYLNSCLDWYGEKKFRNMMEYYINCVRNVPDIELNISVLLLHMFRKSIISPTSWMKQNHRVIEWLNGNSRFDPAFMKKLSKDWADCLP